VTARFAPVVQTAGFAGKPPTARDLEARTAMLRVVMTGVAVWLGCAAGCGARTDPVLDKGAALQEEGWFVPDASGIGGCKRCSTQVPACTYCMLQGSDAWVCDLGKPAPSGGCMNLQESYNAGGWRFTCYYCD
jgi:hypothetical protein